MADAIAEQILDALTTTVTGLTTTGSNVQRARVYPFAESVNSALTIFMGADEVLQVQANDYIDWELTVVFMAHARATGNPDQTLNQIRKEIHAAIMADHTQGGLVIDTNPVIAEEPELSSGDKPIASMRIEFSFQYRTTRTAIDV